MDASVDGAKTITFTAGSRQTIPTSTKTWTLNGSAGNVLTLESSIPGTAWLFEIDADMNSGDWIDVQDSQNTTTDSRITPGDDVTNSGNNIPGWLFASSGSSGSGPASVLNFQAQGEDSQIILTWNNPTSNFTGLRIQRTNGDYPASVMDGVNIYYGKGTSFIDAGLINEITYFYTAYSYIKPGIYSSGVSASAIPMAPEVELVEEVVEVTDFLTRLRRGGEGGEIPSEEIKKEDIEFSNFDFSIKRDLDWIKASSIDEYHIFTNDEFRLEIDKDIFHKEDESITLRLGSKTYEAKVVDGKYQILGKTPGLKGSYEIVIEIVYKDGEIKTITQDVLIDPYGFVFKKSRSFWDNLLNKEEYEEVRILNAQVTLYSYSQTKRDWQVWDAEEYNQVNPQITNQSGEYSFMTPKGRYYLEAQKAGYQKYKSEEFQVKDEIVNKNIELEPNVSNRVTLIVGIGLLIVISTIVVIYRRKKGQGKMVLNP